MKQSWNCNVASNLNLEEPPWKCYEGHSTSYVVKDLQIKTTMRHCYLSIRILNIQNTDTMLGINRKGSNRNSHSLLVGMENGTAILGDSLAVSYKAK